MKEHEHYTFSQLWIKANCKKCESEWDKILCDVENKLGGIE